MAIRTHFSDQCRYASNATLNPPPPVHPQIPRAGRERGTILTSRIQAPVGKGLDLKSKALDPLPMTLRDGMRPRRGVGGDFRRPGRRKWWWTIRDCVCRPWLVVGGFGLLLLLLLLFFEQYSSFGSDGTTTTGRRVSLRAYHRLRSVTQGPNVTEEMLDPHSINRQLVDQISLAKAYVVIAKESNNLQFAWELSARIRNSQALLSRAATGRVPLGAHESDAAVRDMAVVLFQAQQQLHYDSATAMVKLKGQVQTLEESVMAEKEKSTKYGQIAAEEVPKGLYCLGTRLTMEWFGKPEPWDKKKHFRRMAREKLRDNSLQHYCIFSDNVLAASVVVNSTAVNSLRPEQVVFHLVTDEVNYFAMRAWFSRNSFRGATVEVQKVEDLGWLNASYVPVLKQLQDANTQNFYFSGSSDGRMAAKFRNPKYLSMLNHLRFYIPEVYPALEKVVFLDDDVVVQKDLSELFSIDLGGNVMGAVETCMEMFHRFHKYLNYSHPLIRAHFDPDACGWAFGMNVIDLREWRKRNVTGIYHYWQERNADHTLWKLGSLPPGLLAFYGLVETLDPSWHVLGLGYSNVDRATIRNGAVVHWNGNQKPWLKIANERYKEIWDKYVDYSHPLLQMCNVR